MRAHASGKRCHGPAACCLAGALAVLCLAAPGSATDDDNGYKIGTGYERLASSFHPLGRDFWVMGRLESEIQAELDPDLRSEPEDEDEVEVESEAIIALAWQPSEHFRAVVRGELSQQFVLEPSDEDDPDPKLSLDRAYVVAEELVPGTVLVVGRQNFVDERKWIWEEPLDGIRAIWRRDAFALDLAAARDELVQRRLLERRDPEGGNYLWGSGRYAFTEEVEGAVYVLYFDDRRRRNDDFVFLGLQSRGEVIDNVGHWLEAAVVTGEERGRDVLGFGFDAGATWEAGLPLEPAFTLGVAFGSGDDGDGQDTAFRQTGLQENSAKFAGEASFDYYGQVLDPELSNLLILTAGMGIRPMPESSVDLVYHHYRQVQRSDELRDAGLDVDPNGESAYLGNGLDLVLGWDATDRLSLEAAGGVFLPGAAFDADNPSYQLGAEIVFRF